MLIFQLIIIIYIIISKILVLVKNFKILVYIQSEEWFINLKIHINVLIVI